MRGTGEAIVRATGARTEFGRIGTALGSIEREPPRPRAIAVTALVAALVALIPVNRAFGASPREALVRPNPVLLRGRLGR